jgi:7-carboxy-7-deazaguanine synthase
VHVGLRLRRRASVKYAIANIFWSLQGEGRFVGLPTVFVRLAGCSVAKCHIRKECDEAPWRAQEHLSAEEVLERASFVSGSCGKVICITGGEPTDHDISPLVSAIHGAGYDVHMETSGIREVKAYPIHWLTVSPKIRGPLAQRTGHALKIVIRPDWSDDDAWSFVEDADEGSSFSCRYLQPLSVGSTNNLEQVTRMLLGSRNRGARWSLSAQAHRTWGLR